MFDRIFANYLVSEGKLDEKQLAEAFTSQAEKRVRLGEDDDHRAG